MPLHGGLDKHNVVHPHRETVFGFKEDGNSDTCHNMRLQCLTYPEARPSLAQRPAATRTVEWRQASGGEARTALLFPAQRGEAPAHSRHVITGRRLLQEVAAESMRARSVSQIKRKCVPGLADGVPLGAGPRRSQA